MSPVSLSNSLMRRRIPNVKAEWFGPCDPEDSCLLFLLRSGYTVPRDLLEFSFRNVGVAAVCNEHASAGWVNSI